MVSGNEDLVGSLLGSEPLLEVSGLEEVSGVGEVSGVQENVAFRDLERSMESMGVGDHAEFEDLDGHLEFFLILQNGLGHALETVACIIISQQTTIFTMVILITTITSIQSSKICNFF